MTYHSLADIHHFYQMDKICQNPTLEQIPTENLRVSLPV